MKLHCFAGFWTRKTLEEEDSSPWIFGGVNEVKIIPPKKTQPFASVEVLEHFSSDIQTGLASSEVLMANSRDKIYEDFRHILKNKAEKHKNYFRTLIGSSRTEEQALQFSEEMATRLPTFTEPLSQTAISLATERNTKSEGSTVKTNSGSTEGTLNKRQRRQGVYERDALQCEAQERNIFKSVRQLRDEYLAMLDKTTKSLGQATIELEAPKSNRKSENYSENLLVPPQSDYCSSSASGTSDDEREKTNWHRKHKVTRCGSSDSAVGHSDEDPQPINEEIKDCNIPTLSENPIASPYSPRGSIDHSNVPSKIIIEAQTVMYPVDRKCSVDCVSEDTDFDPNDSRRQSCFTDDSDDTARYRCWRTPSVVVSDYSDDVMGLTLEDIEYIRSHRKETSSSPESSLHSSCSNLNYCGSTISGLDSEYVLTKPYRKSSNCSTCSTLSGDEDQEASFETATTDSTLRPRNVREVSPC